MRRTQIVIGLLMAGACAADGELAPDGANPGAPYAGHYAVSVTVTPATPGSPPACFSDIYLAQPEISELWITARDDSVAASALWLCANCSYVYEGEPPVEGFVDNLLDLGPFTLVYDRHPMEDVGYLRAAHLILEFTPLAFTAQETEWSYEHGAGGRCAEGVMLGGERVTSP